MGARRDIDAARPDDYLGKTILVGITYVDSNERVVGSIQWHGVIEAIDPLLAIRVAGTDETRTLPPQVEDAGPGEYTLRATGEVVTDPDFLATWTVETKAPPPHDRPNSYNPTK
jgi:hypothetical protein